MDESTKPRVVALGASSPEALATTALEWADRVEKEPSELAALIAETDLSEIATSQSRLGLATRKADELVDQLRRAARFLETGKGKRLLPGRGIFVRPEPPEPGRLAMLFPGQGAQSVGMMGELSDYFGVVLETLQEAEEILRDELERPLLDSIHGRNTTPEEAARELTQTAITQPAILACDLAMLRLLDSHGVRPDLVAGHSLGEYAACVAAGVLSSADALRAVAARGRAMTNATPEGTDPGKMAAVGASLADVEPLLEKVDGYVIPANKNCRAQTIVAGESVAVERAMDLFDEESLQTTQLPVSHAFHTKIVEPASRQLADVLRKLELRSPSIPVLSNVTGSEYPTGDDAPDEIVELLARQVASPVEFISEIERMYELGARTFIEVGPKRTLTTFVGNVLGKQPHLAQATNSKRKGDLRSYVEALAALVAAGVQPNIEPINGAQDSP